MQGYNYLQPSAVNETKEKDMVITTGGIEQKKSPEKDETIRGPSTANFMFKSKYAR